MPKIQWERLPREKWAHLRERAKERQISAEDLFELAEWKAPKLQPTKYKPEFVWDRVHNGFRSMPAWKELYNDEQVISIVAWVMSAEFWP